MEITSHDIGVIERALKAAIQHETDINKVRDYREVLLKLEDSTRSVMHDPISGEALDGIRYDYDDTSDLL